MRRKAALAACLIALAFSFSLIAVVYSQSNTIQEVSDSRRFVFSLPFMLGAGLHNNSEALNQPTRAEIYNFVKNNPGIHFRGICSNLGLSIGVVQHHLDVLADAGLLSVYNDGQYRRYFESNIYAETDAQFISLLRHGTTGKILTALLQSGPILHKDLTRKLGLSSQALTWQMNQLKRTGLIEAVKEGMSVKYSLNEESATTLRLLLNLIGCSGMKCT